MRKLFPYLSYLQPVRGKLILAILCGLLYGASTGIAIPVVLKTIYPMIFASTSLSIGMVIFYCLLPVVAAAIRGLSGLFNTYYIGFCGQYLLQQLRLEAFDKIQRLQLSYFHKNPPGVLMTRSMNDTGLLQASLIEFAQEIVKQPTTLIGTLGFMAYLCFINAENFFLLVFILAIPLCVFPIRQIGLKMRSKVGNMQQQVSHMSTRIMQNLSAAQEIRAYNMEEQEMTKFRKACKLYTYNIMKVLKYDIILSPIIEVIAAAGIGWALYYAYYNKIEPENFIALCTALYLSYDPIKRLGRLHGKIQEGLVGLERMETLLHEPITIVDPEHPQPVGRLVGSIHFDHVHFAYQDAPVLQDVDQHLTAGQTYALVGHSGAGKSTFANLIPRFFDVIDGAVKIDGIDIRQMTLQDLRRNIAIVSQDPVLFNDTIRANILVGDPNATHEQIVEAATKAFANDFISAMDDGYDTQVDEGGARLSGGQRQRIALARAFLKDAPILILDEATSALDANSERSIQMALEKLFANKTVIIIAHRFSSIRHADEILVFDHGKIVERGSHDDLFSRESVYKNLYEKQIT